LKKKVYLGYGFVMGFFLFILALTVRFWTIGFLLSLTMLIIFGIKIYIEFKNENREQALNDHDSDGANAEYSGPTNHCGMCKAGIYCCTCLEIFLVIFVTILVLERFVSLTIRDVNFKTFPSECSSWATLGCTRIVLNKNGCTRPEDIPKTYSTVFEYKSEADLNQNLMACVDDVNGGALYDKSGSGLNQLLHITAQRPIFGFLDDMYVGTKKYNNNLNIVEVSTQSQLRIGKEDMN